jgi:hypothetical protein
VKQIPNVVAEISVTGSEGSSSLAAYKGRWIRFRARDVSVSYREASSSPTMVLNEGPTLDIGEESEWWYIPYGDDQTLWHIASGAGTLEIHDRSDA